MEIQLQNTGKRFENTWIFKQLNETFLPGTFYAVTGPNGSGKSTLLQMLAGYITPSAGQIVHRSAKQQPIDQDHLFNYLTVAAPFSELIEEFSLIEVLAFQMKFKKTLKNLSLEDLVDLHGYKSQKHKPVRYFSSGMQQRIKLILAFCFQSDLLLLDEPTSYLDQQGKDWFENTLLNEFSGQERLIIMATNNAYEKNLSNTVFSIRPHANSTTI